MTRLVDLPRVQRALERIRRTLRTHPELAERTRDYLAGELPEGPAADPMRKGTPDGKTRGAQ